MVGMAFCNLSHTFHKQVTNVSQHVFCHSTVRYFDVSPNPCVGILLKGIILNCLNNRDYSDRLHSGAENSKAQNEYKRGPRQGVPVSPVAYKKSQCPLSLGMSHVASETQ